MTPTESELITIAEAAGRTGWPVSTLLRWAMRGKVRSARAGREWRVNPADLPPRGELKPYVTRHGTAALMCIDAARATKGVRRSPPPPPAPRKQWSAADLGPTSAVLEGRSPWAVEEGDCLDWLLALPADCLDLVVTSPPFERARHYGIGFRLEGQEWVDWMAERVVAMARACRGLVCVNMAGQVRRHSYSPVAELLVADLVRNHGLVCGPAPYCYSRSGLPGSGGRHYHRRDWEPVYCFARPECLPLRWSDNTALGRPPKWTPADDAVGPGAALVGPNGARKKAGPGLTTDRKTGRPADARTGRAFKPPAVANPGNVVRCKVGRGIGSPHAHGNDAPFAERLAGFFVASYAPPGGVVCDTFAGSGTTGAVAVRLGRRFLGCDVRPCQGALSARRIGEAMRAAQASPLAREVTFSEHVAH